MNSARLAVLVSLCLLCACAIRRAPLTNQALRPWDAGAGAHVNVYDALDAGLATRPAPLVPPSRRLPTAGDEIVGGIVGSAVAVGAFVVGAYVGGALGALAGFGLGTAIDDGDDSLDAFSSAQLMLGFVGLMVGGITGGIWLGGLAAHAFGRGGGDVGEPATPTTGFSIGFEF